MAAKASTPADHHALEEYFLTLAKRYTADANEHAATANTYRGTRIAQAAVHCDRLVETVARRRRRKPPRLRRCTSSLPASPGNHRVRSPGPAMPPARSEVLEAMR